MVPKEMCHLALGNPHPVKKPMRLRWCTKAKPENLKVPQYKPSYLPPAPPTRRASSSTTYTPSFQSNPVDFTPPSFSSPTSRPAIQFQRRSEQPVPETKFKPKLPIKPEPVDIEQPQHILIEDFFVQNSEEDLELITKSHAEALQATTTTTAKPTQVTFKPKKPERKIPDLVPVSISDDLSGLDSYSSDVFGGGEDPFL